MRVASLLITIAIGLAVGVAITAEWLTVGQTAIAAALGVAAWFIGYMLLANVHARRFNAQCVEAMAMLGRGEHEKAAQLWAGWGRRITVPAVIVAAARHNVAWATLRRGQLREALALFEQNETKNLKWLRANLMDSISALDRALCHALAGELEPARHALAEAGMRSHRTHPSYTPMKGFVEAVIACREGRADAAATNLAKHWAEYENMTTGDVSRPMRIVRAFASKMAIEPSSAPAYPDEYAFLGVAWPEMAQYIERSGSGAPA